MPIRLPLQCHPDTPCGALTGIEVEVARQSGRRSPRIDLRFVATGNLRAIRAPGYTTTTSRGDELWRHTCFEAFIRVGARQSYHEFNFAPSGEWACYRFDGYRSGMENEPHVGEPGIETEFRNKRFTAERSDGLKAAGFDTLDRFEAPFFSLTATLALERAQLALDEPWHLGLSAVIEERNGNMSYWALGHPSGQADFHHQDCFALELAPARPS